jgi:hypothetical protein
MDPDENGRIDAIGPGEEHVMFFNKFPDLAHGM